MEENKTKFKKDLFRGARTSKGNSKNRGITLIALIITIIILLILAGIPIATLSNSGLFNKTQKAKEEWNNSQEKDELELSKSSNEIDKYVDGNRDANIDELVERIERLESNTYEKVILYDTETATAGQKITFLNNHTIDEFESLRFLYRTRDNYYGEYEILVDSYKYVKNKNRKLGLWGYGTYFFNIIELSDTGFKIESVGSHTLCRIYGIKK